MVLTLDQAGALPDSLSPMVAEDGSVIEKLYSPHVRESIQIKTAALHPLMYLTNRAFRALACWTRDNAPAKLAGTTRRGNWEAKLNGRNWEPACG